MSEPKILSDERLTDIRAKAGWEVTVAELLDHIAALSAKLDRLTQPLDGDPATVAAERLLEPGDPDVASFARTIRVAYAPHVAALRAEIDTLRVRVSQLLDDEDLDAAYARGRADGIEAAAKCSQGIDSPCSCVRKRDGKYWSAVCECGNSDDAVEAGCTAERLNIHDAIRALAEVKP